MNKIIIFVVTIILLFLNTNLVQAEKNVSDTISAEAWVVMDSKTGEILLEKSMNETHFPASITKIVTAIIAIEERNLTELVTISQHAAATEGSSLELKEGDQLSLQDLLYGIMLHSGNDGAVAVAEHISQTETEFAQKMTSFAQSVGAKNTNFVNASGLPNDQHNTTAYDVAIITRYAMKNPIFKEIVGHQTYRWRKDLWSNNLEVHEKEEAKKLGLSWTGEPQVINHNRMLHFYDGATGVKNGFTHEARYTVVGTAKRKDTELIAVILRSDNVDTAYQDMRILLDEGFALSSKNVQQEPNNVINSNDKQSTDLSGEQTKNEKKVMQSTKYEKLLPNEERTFLYFLILGSILLATVLLFLRKKSNKKFKGNKYNGDIYEKEYRDAK
jgi:D-alanyl-D-alanine carboxypeptidase (penicillin-binding protein 5/6)